MPSNWQKIILVTTAVQRVGFVPQLGGCMYVNPLSCFIHVHGRHSCLVVSELDAGLRGPGSSPGWVILLCSWARHFTLTVPLSTQESKWVLAHCQGNPFFLGGGGGNLRWTSIPYRRSSNTPSWEYWDKLRLCGLYFT